LSGPAELAPPGSASLNPRIIVPDAGVGVKWFLTEAHNDDAKRLLTPRFELHIPSYFFAEAASVIQQKVAVDRTLRESEGLEAFDRLRTVPMTIHATDALLEAALLHGIRYRRPVYDSLYLVLAAAVGGQVRTADQRLYRGVQGGPLAHLVVWITDPL